ncbi:MAG: hypothetical protein HOP12_02320 [Candidatus Eisenbacteria bacterium]|uniref:Uncharacterized protein n=1 Tax=Eiseniibacteriota bacterium TaxID=2212470 RepID=A0A849SM77_UNCEI|nr:hypothetical protein [Candidatus Eisenbacteria bacterium]
MNAMGFRTKEGELWKRTRTQQVVMNGLARAAAFHAIFLDSNDRKLGRDFEAAIRDAEKETWALFQRKRRAVKNGEKVDYGTLTVNGESRVCDRAPLSEQYWAMKKLTARRNGWKSPEPWFASPPEELYVDKRQLL